MTSRQQLILFVLALATLSTCTVGFALVMNLAREMAVSADAAELPSVAEPAAGGVVAWNLPPTSAQAAEPAQPQGPPTPTRPPTPTNTRVPTWTPSPTYTPTATRVPTDTPVPPTNTPPPPPPPSDVSAPAPPPPAPTPIPTHEFPYDVMLEIFDTGTPQLTRVTGMVWKIVDVNMAIYDGEPGYQMRLVDPHGRVHMSEVSGPGGTSSTCAGCGDNWRMNMKIEVPPYLPGEYRVALLRDGEQMAREVTFTLAVQPEQYVHVNFVPWE